MSLEGELPPIYIDRKLQVGVVYMEQFEPENSLGYAAYFQG